MDDLFWYLGIYLSVAVAIGLAINSYCRARGARHRNSQPGSPAEKEALRHRLEDALAHPEPVMRTELVRLVAHESSAQNIDLADLVKAADGHRVQVISNHS